MSDHPREAIELLSRAICNSQIRSLIRIDQGMRIVTAPDKMVDAINEAIALLDRLAPILFAHAEAVAAQCEKCAQVAEAEAAPGMYQGASVSFKMGYDDACLHIAAAIRALNPQEPK